MIERLVHALQVLAAPADVQLARFADPIADANELAGDFDDALRLILDCPQIELQPGQREALLRLDRQFEAISGRDRADLWTGSALRERPEWLHIRELAAQALDALGQPRTMAPPAREGSDRDRAP